ncbi:MAG: S8 family serine peptidase [Sporichthyaceae bacterium]
MSRIRAGAAALGVAGASLAAVLPARGDAPGSAPASIEYVVLNARTASSASVADAVARAGGEIVSVNPSLGSTLVRAAGADFAPRLRRSDAVAGVARNRSIGHSPALRPARALIEGLSAIDRAHLAAGTGPPRLPTGAGADLAAEPLAAQQWDMAMIGATPEGSYATETGDRRVLVGVIDTGVDAAHPDIAPNLDIGLSRNFVTDLPAIDGACEASTCVDAIGIDDHGHGTHIAATIGAPINGIGIAGVAPNITLVDVRAGQDSGFFLLDPVIAALTYAADTGLDVVNLSFYVDPWLYNCGANVADTPQAAAEQLATVAAVQRAVDYALSKGVTLVGALGNQSTDLGAPVLDTSSPNIPAGSAYNRRVDNTCLSVPAESTGVISISALGPSGRKAYYSNYGLEQTDLAAPGGDAFDTLDNTISADALVLSAYPESLGRRNGDIDADGLPTSALVLRSCLDTICGYYQYLQGTSMAAPHASGVAALVVSRFGTDDGATGFGLDPELTEFALTLTATPRECPSPADFTYILDRPSGISTMTHRCEGDSGRNGFYGRGIVSAIGVTMLPRLAGLVPGPGSLPPPPPPM